MELQKQIYEKAYVYREERCATCGKTTREGKKYCFEHLAELPYVREIEHRLAVVQAEDAKALEAKHLYKIHSTAKDILHFLAIEHAGERKTNLKIAKTLGISLPVVDRYIHHLRARGLVTVRLARRRSVSGPARFLVRAVQKRSQCA